MGVPRWSGARRWPVERGGFALTWHEGCLCAGLGAQPAQAHLLPGAEGQIPGPLLPILSHQA